MKPQSSHKLLTQAPEVSSCEGGVVSESIAEHPVETNRSGPDTYESAEAGAMCGQSHHRACQRQNVAVNEVIAAGTGAGTDQVAEHRQIGQQKKDSEDPPSRAQMSVEKEAQRERGRAFASKPYTHAAGEPLLSFQIERIGRPIQAEDSCENLSPPDETRLIRAFYLAAGANVASRYSRV